MKFDKVWKKEERQKIGVTGRKEIIEAFYNNGALQGLPMTYERFLEESGPVKLFIKKVNGCFYVKLKARKFNYVSSPVLSLDLIDDVREIKGL